MCAYVGVGSGLKSTFISYFAKYYKKFAKHQNNRETEEHTGIWNMMVFQSCRKENYSIKDVAIYIKIIIIQLAPHHTEYIKLYFQWAKNASENTSMKTIGMNKYK